MTEFTPIVVPLAAVTLTGHEYTNCRVSRSCYVADGVPAIWMDVWDEEWQGWEALTTATVNLKSYDYKPADGCTFVRDDAENTGALAALVELGVVETTGRTVRFGFTGVAHEVRLIGAFA